MIEEEERDLIEQIIEFGDTVVREVMVPRPDMVTVSADFRVDDVMEVMILNGFSRVPAVGEGIDDVVGVVYAKDLMRAERDGQRRASGQRAHAGGAVRAGDRSASPSSCAEMQADHVPPGGRRRRVRRHRRAGHARGSDRGARRRDHRRVRPSRKPQVERLPTGELRVNAAHAHRRGERAARPRRCPRTATGTRSAACIFDLLGHVPAEGESVECAGTGCGPSRCSGVASVGCASPGRAG